MNIFQCRNGFTKEFQCIFNLTGDGCLRCGGNKGHDTFNLYPEIEGTNPLDHTTGDVVYQPTNPTDPYKIGEMLSFENITGHQNGRNFDLRKFDADIHPLYHRIDYNLPIHKSEYGSLIPLLEKDIPGEVFGDELTLVYNGWMSEKFIGKSNIEYCKSFYGKFSSYLGYVSHSCLKVHYTPDWINFTNQNIPTKELYIAYSNKEKIINYLSDYIDNKKVIQRLTKGLIYSTSKYLNVYTLFRNNDVDTNILRNISTENIDNIYKRPLPIQTLCQLYVLIGRSNLDRYKINFLKRNLLNYVLNSSVLRNIEIENRKYNPRERWWFIIHLIKNAYKDGTINRKIELPNYLSNLFNYDKNFSINIFNNKDNYNNLTTETKNDIIDSMLYNTDGYKQDKDNLFNNLYPEMITLNKLINEELSTINHSEFIKPFLLKQFKEILDLGVKWTFNEIKVTLKVFIKSYIQDNPDIFYNWLNKLSDNIDKCYDLGITSRRIFIINILSGSLRYNNWESWDDFNCTKVALGNWYETNCKKKILRECNHETFWSMYIAVKKGKCIDKEDYQEVYENYISNVASISSTIQAGLDESDYHSYDPTTGECRLMNEKEGSWISEE